MATSKVTFTFDVETINRIDEAATRLAKAKSQVVREAVAEYYNRIGRLSDSERMQMLKVFDDLVPAIPDRPQGAAENELREIRRARRSGGRLSLAGNRP